MRGDKLVIKEHHVRAAGQVAEVVLPEIKQTEGRYAITIAGESGSGKSDNRSGCASPGRGPEFAPGMDARSPDPLRESAL